ncbi:DUF2065 family protein [Mangrovicoccus algicola]|uniref:DUF2065 domain-containing protein n=1 Tax=Mangrovicoccus algicola TaxID=2771008 RepID=A0A8J6Z0P4_9RHOB|nr:DUF2065 family protein [Mangrovicoccus algicola]MBE3640474.1 DUF2065 domain-containing protein [Mangrovicoccus algicola]
MTTLLSAVGFVLVFEGLVFALLPSRLESLIETLSRFSTDARRGLGLGALALGVLLLWLSGGGGL